MHRAANLMAVLNQLCLAALCILAFACSVQAEPEAKLTNSANREAVARQKRHEYFDLQKELMLGRNVRLAKLKASLQGIGDAIFLTNEWADHKTPAASPGEGFGEPKNSADWSTWTCTFFLLSSPTEDEFSQVHSLLKQLEKAERKSVGNNSPLLYDFLSLAGKYCEDNRHSGEAADFFYKAEAALPATESLSSHDWWWPQEISKRLHEYAEFLMAHGYAEKAASIKSKAESFETRSMRIKSGKQ